MCVWGSARRGELWEFRAGETHSERALPREGFMTERINYILKDVVFRGSKNSSLCGNFPLLLKGKPTQVTICLLTNVTYGLPCDVELGGNVCSSKTSWRHFYPVPSPPYSVHSPHLPQTGPARGISSCSVRSALSSGLDWLAGYPPPS